MPDTNSWILQAIEDAAFKRALDHIRRYNNETFTFMGFSPQQLSLMVLAGQKKGCRPGQSLEELKEMLDK